MQGFEKGQFDENGKPICGAKTRAGTPCKNAPMPNGRCRMHGGKSLSGAAHPNFKHGRYSKYLPDKLAHRYAYALDDPDLLNLRHQIALTTTFITDMLEQLSGGADWQVIAELISDMQETLAHARVAIRQADTQAFTENLNTLEGLVNQAAAISQKGVEDEKVLDRVGEQIDRQERLVRNERTHQERMQQIITVEQAMTLIGAFVAIIQRHVNDRAILSAISRDVGNLIGEEGTEGIGSMVVSGAASRDAG